MKTKKRKPRAVAVQKLGRNAAMKSQPIAEDVVAATLKERGSRYGAFTGHAKITQNLKRAMADSPNWAALADDQREALEMLAHKVGRILNGDPDYADSWLDIEGYTALVRKRLEGEVL